MPLRVRKGRPEKYLVKDRGGKLYITLDGGSLKGSASPSRDVTFKIGKPGKYLVEKRSGKLYVLEVGGHKMRKKILFRARGEKVVTSSDEGLDKKLTKAFASAVKSAL
jgi:hypothetical protein